MLEKERKIEVEEGDEIMAMQNKEEIERMIIKHNKEHFSKVKSTKKHNDKMHKIVNENKTRDAIMKGELNRDECDDEEVYQFLRLLKRPNRLTLDEEDFVQMNEWKQVARKAKKTQHIIYVSRRDHVVHKCALESERMVEVLVQFHNVIMKHNHHPKRWLKVVDVVIEKGKGHRIEKSRILEMIEADFAISNENIFRK